MMVGWFRVSLSRFAVSKYGRAVMGVIRFFAG
jgi:hypothetical protein